MTSELHELSERLDSLEQRIATLEARAGLSAWLVAGPLVRASNLPRQGTVTIDLLKMRAAGFEERIARLEGGQHE